MHQAQPGSWPLSFPPGRRRSRGPENGARQATGQQAGKKGDEQTPTPGAAPGLAAPAAPIGKKRAGELDCSPASRRAARRAAPFLRARSAGQRREPTVTSGPPDAPASDPGGQLWNIGCGRTLRIGGALGPPGGNPRGSGARELGTRAPLGRQCEDGW
jgi:hypothetical protein